MTPGSVPGNFSYRVDHEPGLQGADDGIRGRIGELELLARALYEVVSGRLDSDNIDFDAIVDTDTGLIVTVRAAIGVKGKIGIDPAVVAPTLDHGALDATSLADDDHPQYSLADGTRPFTGTVGFTAGLDVTGGAFTPRRMTAEESNTRIFAVGEMVLTTDRPGIDFGGT